MKKITPMLNIIPMPSIYLHSKQKLWRCYMLCIALIITGCSSGADPPAPYVVSAISISNTEVLVQFSKAVAGGQDGAENQANYSIMTEVQETRLPVQSAVFSSRYSTTVLLTTASQSGLSYKLTVSNIRDEFGTPMAVSTILVDPSSTTFVGTAPSGDAIIDSDGDGLSDNVEINGWIVNIKRTDGENQTRTVTSSPYSADTDNDGVSDKEELNGGMDPRNSDTDGDTLTDNDEWNSIYSDPTAQDSDYDGLPDGVEYLTFRTSPILADTDGDQIPDPDEVFSGNRDPLLSDLPSPRITVGNINLELDIRFTFTDEEGNLVTENRTAETTLSRGENDTSSTSNETSTKNTTEFSEELLVSWNSGGGAGQPFPGVTVTGTVGSKQGSERGSTFTSGQESGRSSEEAYHDSLTTSTARDIRKSVTREIVGATVKAFLSIDNAGDIPFTISNLELTAQSQDPGNRRRIIPVASLVPENDSLGFVNIGALGDPSRGPFVFATKASSVFPQQVQELMKNPRGLVVQLANFDITDENDRNFSFTSQEVLDRTAGISFDLGDGRVETYRVATASTHDPATGRPLGITMERALNIIGLHRYATIRDGGNGIVDTTATGDDEQGVLPGRQIEPGEIIVSAGENGLIDSAHGGDDTLILPDYETQLHENFSSIRDGGNGIVDTVAIFDDVQNVAVGSPVNAGQVIITVGDNQVLDTLPVQDDVVVTALAPHRVLTRYRDVEVDANSKRFWVLFKSREGAAVDLDNYVIRAGEQFNFTYVQDKDDDGVWAREESLHGSSDLLPNTDGCNLALPPDPCDTLTDKEEIQQGWLVQLKGSPQANRAYPNPNQGDSDRDMITDDQERACRLDPRQRDTDLDGLTDWEELNGKLLEGGDIDGNMVSRDPGTDQIIYTITPYDGNPGDVRTPHEAVPACSLALAIDGFATDPLNADTDGDLVDDALELQLGLNPNDSSDGPLFLDDDGDGVPNKIEQDGFVAIVNGVPQTFTSNPNDRDSDDDGLPDLLEHFIYSNPLAVDTDGDGISDTNEYKVGGDACVTQTLGNLCVSFADLTENNFQSFVAECDDADQCNNADIESYLVSINAKQYGTNLNEKDSDSDGLNDPVELSELVIAVNGGNVMLDAPSSNPIDPDTDNDSILDGEEATAGLDGYITNPQEADTDGDGRTDPNEISLGTDPAFKDKMVTVKSTGFNITVADEAGDKADMRWWAKTDGIEVCSFGTTNVQLNQFVNKLCTYFENVILRDEPGTSTTIQMFGHEVDDGFDGSGGGNDEVCNVVTFTFSYSENTDVPSVTATHKCDNSTYDLGFTTELNITVQ